MFTYYTDWTKMVTHILFIWGVTHDRTNLKVAGSHAKINQNFVKCVATLQSRHLF